MWPTIPPTSQITRLDNRLPTRAAGVGTPQDYRSSTESALHVFAPPVQLVSPVSLSGAQTAPRAENLLPKQISTLYTRFTVAVHSNALIPPNGDR